MITFTYKMQGFDWSEATGQFENGRIFFVIFVEHGTISTKLKLINHEAKYMDIVAEDSVTTVSRRHGIRWKWNIRNSYFPRGNNGSLMCCWIFHLWRCAQDEAGLDPTIQSLQVHWFVRNTVLKRNVGTTKQGEQRLVTTQRDMEISMQGTSLH